MDSTFGTLINNFWNRLLWTLKVNLLLLMPLEFREFFIFTRKYLAFKCTYPYFSKKMFNIKKRMPSIPKMGFRFFFKLLFLFHSLVPLICLFLLQSCLVAQRNLIQSSPLDSRYCKYCISQHQEDNVGFLWSFLFNSGSRATWWGKSTHTCNPKDPCIQCHTIQQKTCFALPSLLRSIQEEVNFGWY